MSDSVMLLLTGVIAVSTVIYTWFSIKLWRATRVQADTARYVAISNLLQQMSVASDALKRDNPSASPIVDSIMGVFADAVLARLASELKLNKPGDARDTFHKLEGMLRAHGVDPLQLHWLRPVVEQLRTK